MTSYKRGKKVQGVLLFFYLFSRTSGVLFRWSAKEGYQSAGVMYVAMQGRGPQKGRRGAGAGRWTRW